MNTQHTPGPWHVGMKPGPMVYGPFGEQVANMHVAMLDQQEHIANARLIAAAPELLGMLKDAEMQLSRLTGESLEAYARTFAAIAKTAIRKATQP